MSIKNPSNTSSISPLGAEFPSKEPSELFTFNRGPTLHHKTFEPGRARLPTSLYSDCPQRAAAAGPFAASRLRPTERLLHSRRRQGSTKLPRGGSTAGGLPPQRLPLQPQRDGDVRGVLPATSGYTLHEGPCAFQGGLEKGDQSLRTGLPHSEQPGTGALHAEQRMAGQEHDSWSQAASEHEVQDTPSAQGNQRIPHGLQREEQEEGSSTAKYANIFWHSLLCSHKEVCELCPEEQSGSRPVGMVQRHLQSG